MNQWTQWWNCSGECVEDIIFAPCRIECVEDIIFAPCPIESPGGHFFYYCETAYCKLIGVMVWPQSVFFFSAWHFFMGVTFDFWNLSRPFFRCHGHFFENCHGRFGNVTGKNVTGRCHGHFSTFWDLSRAFSKCHGHFLFLFFYHKVKFHKIIWLKEYRLYRISSPRGSSFTAKKTLKMYQ